MDTEIRNPVLRSLVYGHFVLAAGAALQLWWVDSVAHLHSDRRLIVAVALASFAAYGAMRLMRMNAPELSSNPMMIWYRTHARSMAVLAGGSAIMAVVIAWPLRALAFHALWLPVLLALFYVLPTGITRGRLFGLRRVPFLKAFLIAFVWASIVVLLPGTSEGNGAPVISDLVWWTMSVWFSFFLAIAMTFDIRDLPYDPPSLRTTPQVFGSNGTKLTAILLLVPMVLMLGMLVAIGYDPIEPGWRGPQVDLALVTPMFGIGLLAVAIALARPDRPWWYWCLLLDGAIVLLPLLALLGSLL